MKTPSNKINRAVTWTHRGRPCGAGAGASSRRAFSLIEILVTAALMSFIVLGLLAMFNQTQRAFRSSMTQTDVLEAGRATMDLVTRELEQMAPSQDLRTTNFFVRVSPSFQDPLLQALPGSEELRKNVVQEFYFLSKFNTDWVGTGYRVIPDYTEAGVGSLYRWTKAVPLRSGSLYLPHEFQMAALSNYSRIADGVVSFRLRAFDDRGSLINPGMNRWPKDMDFYTNLIAADQAVVLATNRAVPAFVELEIGMLEQQIFQRWKSLANAAARRNYLSNHSARVHVFRNRVPVRNVDFSAYP